MTDYISREAAIALAKDIIVPTKDGYDYRHCCIDPQDIAELPAADVVEVVHGEWRTALLDHEEFGVRPKVLYCSECHQAIAYKTNYCPNCGAKMTDGGASDALD